MMKKIGIVTRSMLSGGAERVIAQLIKYFDSLNIKCLLITIDKEEVFYDLPQSTSLYSIGRKSKNKVIDRILRYREVRNILLNNNVDVVLSMPEEIGIYLIPALLGTNIPIIVSERNNPWIMPDKKITRFMRKIFYPCLDGIIFQTEMAASFFNKKLQEKAIILSNPLDVERIPKPYNGERRKEIVSAGRLVDQKNFKLLIEAFGEFYKDNKDYKLIIYGEGNSRADLEKIIKRKLLEDVCFLPGRSTDLLEKINGASMFVLTSDYEGVPNVLIEAMAMGMPVISTDCPPGGPRTLIENEKNGLLIPINDKEELIKAMNKLKDNYYSEKLGKNAFYLKKKLGGKITYEKWYKYINKIASKSTGLDDT